MFKITAKSINDSKIEERNHSADVMKTITPKVFSSIESSLSFISMCDDSYTFDVSNCVNDCIKKEYGSAIYITPECISKLKNEIITSLEDNGFSIELSEYSPSITVTWSE